MIKAVNITYSYTDVPLFVDGNFTVGTGNKVGLVGPNGAGKSTLFSLIMGKYELDKGKLVTDGSIGFVPQEVKYDPIMESAVSIRDYVDPENLHEDYQLEKMLAGLELHSLALSSPPQQLSGGQKTKLALLRALVQEPDILLLDEPTNFVDVDGKKWVMHFLAHYPKTLLLISHDLKLIDVYIDKVIAIDPLTKKIDEFNGNYTTFVAVKKQRDELARRHIMMEQKHLIQMKKGLEKMARYTSEKGVRRRTNLKRRIQKIQLSLPDMPQEIRGIKCKMMEPAWMGETPFIIKNLCKSYDDNPVLDNVSFSIRRFERIVLVGPNGVGKSTLIKILMGILEKDSGEIIPDEKVKIGYYSQEFETFDMEKTVLDTINEFAPQTNESFIRPLLARFMFQGRKVFQPVKTLSGGEKTRLSLAMLLLRDFNLLILDEPTTYLDVLSQRIILEALKQYKGTMLLVSHTETFIKELKPTKALLMSENKLVEWSDDLLDKVNEM